MTKTVALYGGSFNPSTEAHRNSGLLLRDQLPVDEVWYLVSPQNPFKQKDGMASFADRVTMAKLNVGDCPGLIVKDIEAKYAASMPGSVIESADTLKRLTQEFPDHRFIWAIGADNFAIFHQWGNAQYIMDHFPIAVIPRAGYTEAALRSPAAARMTQLEKPEDMKIGGGWYMLKADGNTVSATICRNDLAEDHIPKSMRPEVAHYALDHRLYHFGMR